MDYFCEACSSKPGWPFDKEKIFRHACQRCFQMRDCNDYAWKTGRVKPGAAPRPSDLVKTQVNPHAESSLPKLPGHREAPARVEKASGVPVAEQSEADKALEAVTPNRKGITMEKINKSQARL